MYSPARQVLWMRAAHFSVPRSERRPKSPAFLVAVLGFISLLQAPGLIWAQDCLACHGLVAGLKNSAGKPITVDPAQFQKSVHSDFPCIRCHAGAARFPHTAKEASSSCAACHSDIPKVLAGSMHAALGDPADPQTCITCHGTHDVKRPSALVVMRSRHAVRRAFVPFQSPKYSRASRLCRVGHLVAARSRSHPISPPL